MILPPDQNVAPDRDGVAVLRLVDRFQRAVQRRDRAEIVERLAELVARRAPMADQWLQLALMAHDLGEVTLARQAIDLFVESSGGGPAALFKKAGFFAHIAAFDEALALLRTLSPTALDPFAYAISRGGSALSVGETGEAREWLEEALRQRPQSGAAWHSLAKLIDFAQEPELADRLVAGAPAMDGAPAEEQALYRYALGKAHADRGEHEKAFAAFARAAAGLKAIYPNNRERDQYRAAEAVRGYDAAGVAAIARQQSEPTAGSIFVMGLPRSGTTLVEQVLTSHSEVAGGGELNLVRLLEHDAGGASFPALQSYVAKAGAPSLAQLWNHLIGERFPGPGRVVDKTTDNSRKLGLVASLLPEAPLVWLRRDPLDCAWSCFRNCFMSGVRWSNDLTDIAFNFRLEDQLLAHWQRVLGDRLLVVPFEALVSEPQMWIRGILAHCGLPEEAQAFAPHENRRVVTTASQMQVRQPINQAGIGSADPYRPFLRSFVDAYFG